jgi:hypothetical protein
MLRNRMSGKFNCKSLWEFQEVGDEHYHRSTSHPLHQIRRRKRFVNQQNDVRNSLVGRQNKWSFCWPGFPSWASRRRDLSLPHGFAEFSLDGGNGPSQRSSLISVVIDFHRGDHSLSLLPHLDVAFSSYNKSISWSQLPSMTVSRRQSLYSPAYSHQ